MMQKKHFFPSEDSKMLEEVPGSKAVQPLSLEVSKKMEKSLSLTRILNLLRLAYRHPKIRF